MHVQLRHFVGGSCGAARGRATIPAKPSPHEFRRATPSDVVEKFIGKNFWYIGDTVSNYMHYQRIRLTGTFRRNYRRCMRVYANADVHFDRPKPFFGGVSQLFKALFHATMNARSSSIRTILRFSVN